MAVQTAKAGWGIQEIGETAGEVWRCLRKKGETSLSTVEQQSGAPKPLTHMAIGWLAREGKLALNQNGRSIQLWLTE